MPNTLYLVVFTNLSRPIITVFQLTYDLETRIFQNNFKILFEKMG